MTNTEKVNAQLAKGITDRLQIAQLTGLKRKQVAQVFQAAAHKGNHQPKGERFKPMAGLNAHQRQASPSYKPRAKQEGEAGHHGIDLMRQPTFDPSKHLGARMGIAR